MKNKTESFIIFRNNLRKGIDSGFNMEIVCIWWLDKRRL